MLNKKKLSNRKMWVRPTLAGRNTAGAFQSTFLVAKEFFFFLSGFSFTNIDDSRDSRGRDRLFL